MFLLFVLGLATVITCWVTFVEERGPQLPAAERVPGAPSYHRPGSEREVGAVSTAGTAGGSS